MNKKKDSVLLSDCLINKTRLYSFIDFSSRDCSVPKSKDNNARECQTTARAHFRRRD